MFDDNDLEAAVEGTLVAKYRYAGQPCANRIYVHEHAMEVKAARPDAFPIIAIAPPN